MKESIAIAGAGFSGAVLARQLAESGRYHVKVFEERGHVAGQCHTKRDASTGILVHEYGPHIFHTDDEEVWSFVNRFGQFGSYINRVKAVTRKGVFGLPINLLTLNQFFGKAMGPVEAREFLASVCDKTIVEPKNFEELALMSVGRDLYENFFLGYTKKHWGVEPRDLPATVFSRLPIRFNYDDNYFSHRFQGIPVEGYTAVISRMLEHAEIEVLLKTPFSREIGRDFAHTFFSGPIDSYFGRELGRLRYRTLSFEPKRAKGDYQGNPVINYCDPEVHYTRVTEHKHFAAWEKHEDTIVFFEYSREMEPGDIPYYPLKLSTDTHLLDEYTRVAGETKNVTFIGRLGTYRYLDMDAVVGESLALAKICLRNSRADWPLFGGCAR